MESMMLISLWGFTPLINITYVNVQFVQPVAWWQSMPKRMMLHHPFVCKWNQVSGRCRPVRVAWRQTWYTSWVFVQGEHYSNKNQNWSKTRKLSHYREVHWWARKTISFKINLECWILLRVAAGKNYLNDKKTPAPLSKPPLMSSEWPSTFRIFIFLPSLSRKLDLPKKCAFLLEAGILKCLLPLCATLGKLPFIRCWLWRPQSYRCLLWFSKTHPEEH